MNNVSALPVTYRVIETGNIEAKLLRCQKLKKEIAALEAEFDMLKKELIRDYFKNNDTYMNAKGLILATYKLQEVKRFQSVEFKQDHPDYYEMYSKIGTEYKFLIK